MTFRGVSQIRQKTDWKLGERLMDVCGSGSEPPLYPRFLLSNRFLPQNTVNFSSLRALFVHCFSPLDRGLGRRNDAPLDSSEPIEHFASRFGKRYGIPGREFPVFRPRFRHFLPVPALIFGRLGPTRKRRILRPVQLCLCSSVYCLAALGLGIYV